MKKRNIKVLKLKANPVDKEQIYFEEQTAVTAEIAKATSEIYMYEIKEIENAIFTVDAILQESKKLDLKSKYERYIHA